MSAVAESPVRIGFLHLGPEVHGIHRYGRIVAGALREVSGVGVIEHQEILTEPGRPGFIRPLRAVWALRHADAVLVPYCSFGLWAESKLRFWQLAVIHLGLRRRTIAVLHDVYSPGGRRRSEWWALALNVLLPRHTVIHGEHDRAALQHMPRAQHAVVIPIFIEPRQLVDRARARQQLGVAPDQQILAMIGWIHPRKNYELIIQALPELERSTQLWLVGDFSGDEPWYLERLERLAGELGVSDRLLVTGYVSEDELNLRLAALDVGICPYHSASASASMSTLLAARRPVAASNIPFAQEILAVSPRVITLPEASDPAALARTIKRIIAHPPSDRDFDNILADRSPQTTASRYLEVVHSGLRRRRLFSRPTTR